MTPLSAPEENEYRWVETSRTALSFAVNKYEMFAFGASSIVPAVGGVNSMSGLSMFTGSQDLSGLLLSDGTTKFSTANTGHSAQFVHGFIDVAPYWAKLKQDIQ